MSKQKRYTTKRWPWQTKPESGSPSTPMNGDSSVTSQPYRQEDIPSNNTLHHSCSTLPYSHFIEIILHGNLRWLIISGHPSPAELQQAWENILQEYSELVRTDKSDNIFDLFKKISQTEDLIFFIDTAIGLLKTQYDAEIADALNEKGFGIVEPSEDREVYLRSLYAIEMSAKMLIVLLNQYRAEYALVSKPTDEQPADNSRFRYEKEIAILSKFQGYRIIKEKITVLEYCAVINNYLDYVKTQKKEVPDGR